MLISAKDAIEKSGFAKSTFYKRVKELNIPTINRGKKIFFETDILEQYFPTKSKGTASVISVANQKGGIGKTTTSINLSIALSLRKFKVLAIDMDPQGNMSKQFIFDPIEFTICNALHLDGRDIKYVPFEKVVVKNKFFDLLPADIRLARFDAPRDIDDYDKLDELVTAVKGLYDFIIIDCPPSLDVKLLNSLVCADMVLVPVKTAQFSLDGMEDLALTINKIKKKKNIKMKVHAVLNEFVERQQLSALSDLVTEYFPLMKTKVPKATDIEKSQINVSPKTYLNESSPDKFQAYDSLAKETIELCQK